MARSVANTLCFTVGYCEVRRNTIGTSNVRVAKGAVSDNLIAAPAGSC